MSAPVYRRWGFEGGVRRSGRGTPFCFSECISSLRVLRIRLDAKPLAFSRCHSFFQTEFFSSNAKQSTFYLKF